jgi:hypothetical protein
MDSAFRLYYCKEDAVATDLLAVKLQEQEIEPTIGPMIEDEPSLGAASHEDETKDEGTLAGVNIGYSQGTFTFNVIV